MIICKKRQNVYHGSEEAGRNFTPLEGNDRVESRQLAAQVGDQDNDNWLLVAPPPEELFKGNSTLGVSRLLLHLLQLGQRCVSATSQPQQGYKEENS